MAIVVSTKFRGIDLPTAYLRIIRLTLEKSQNQIVAEFQIHASSKKEGCLDNTAITTDYIEGEDMFVTVFRALKENYKGAKDEL